MPNYAKKEAKLAQKIEKDQKQLDETMDKLRNEGDSFLRDMDEITAQEQKQQLRGDLDKMNRLEYERQIDHVDKLVTSIKHSTERNT